MTNLHTHTGKCSRSPWLGIYLFVRLFICLFFSFLLLLSILQDSPLDMSIFLFFAMFIFLFFLCPFSSSLLFSKLPNGSVHAYMFKQNRVFFWKILFRCYMAHSCLHMVSVCVNMRVHICIHLVSPRFIQHAHTHTHTHTHVSVHGTARMSASKFSFYFIFFNDSAHGTAPMSASKFARRRNSLTDGGGFSNRQGTASNLNQVPTKKMYKHKFCTYRVCTRIS
jgi:hypothetical protein